MVVGVTATRFQAEITGYYITMLEGSGTLTEAVVCLTCISIRNVV
jgi:hypothetical protein